MFFLPSGPATPNEGHDKEHPIVLDGYKKDEFACLLRIMYPTYVYIFFFMHIDPFSYLWISSRPRALISGLSMEKEEWVSVLKLSSIWIMNEV